MRRLVVSGLAVAAVYVPLHLHTRVADDRWDMVLFWLALSLFVTSIVVMLLGTRRWEMHNLGLFWVVVGLAVLFGRRVLLGITPGWQEVYADLFWATFFVGATLTLLSYRGWFRARRERRRRLD